MRVVPGLIKDGKVQIYIEVQDEPDTLEVIELEGDEDAEEADAEEKEAAEGATDSVEDEDKEDDEDEDEDDDEDEASTSHLESVADAVMAVCDTLHQRLQESFDEDDAPSEFRIEFGITLAGTRGVPVVSQDESAATFKVTVKWEKD